MKQMKVSIEDSFDYFVKRGNSNNYLNWKLR